MRPEISIAGAAVEPGDIARAEAELRRWKLQQARERRGTSAAARRQKRVEEAAARGVIAAEDAVRARNRTRAAAQAASDDREQERTERRMGAALARQAAAERKSLREAPRASQQKPYRVKFANSASWPWQPPLGGEATGIRKSVYRVGGDGKRSVVLNIKANGFNAKRSGRNKGLGGSNKRNLRRVGRYTLRPEALENGPASAIISCPGLIAGEVPTQEKVNEVLGILSSLQRVEMAAAGNRRHLTDTSIILALPSELSPRGRRAIIQKLVELYARRGLLVIAALHSPDTPEAHNAVCTNEADNADPPATHIHNDNYHAHLNIFHRHALWIGPGEVEFGPDRVNPVNDVIQLRARFAALLNEQLAVKGHEPNFTHLSARARGLTPVLERHRGPAHTGRFNGQVEGVTAEFEVAADVAVGQAGQVPHPVAEQRPVTSDALATVKKGPPPPSGTFDDAVSQPSVITPLSPITDLALEPSHTAVPVGVGPGSETCEPVPAQQKSLAPEVLPSTASHVQVVGTALILPQAPAPRQESADAPEITHGHAVQQAPVTQSVPPSATSFDGSADNRFSKAAGEVLVTTQQAIRRAARSGRSGASWIMERTPWQQAARAQEEKLKADKARQQAELDAYKAERDAKEAAESDAARNAFWRKELLGVIERNYLLANRQPADLKKGDLYFETEDRKYVSQVLSSLDRDVFGLVAFEHAFVRAKGDYEDLLSKEMPNARTASGAQVEVARSLDLSQSQEQSQPEPPRSPSGRGPSGAGR